MADNKYTNEHCNAWDCEHNKDGYCESCEALTECNDALLASIAALKKGHTFTIINGIEVDLRDYVEDFGLIRRLMRDQEFKDTVSFKFEKEFATTDNELTGNEILRLIVEQEVDKRR